MKAYYTRLTSDDDKVRAEAGRAWSRWEMATSRVQVDPEYLDRAEDADFADKFARIEVRATPSSPLCVVSPSTDSHLNSFHTPPPTKTRK